MTTAEQIKLFDGLDNRRTVYELFARMGEGEWADKLRAHALTRLVEISENWFAQAMVEFSPCNTDEAYSGFLNITWALGVPIEKAAIELERFIAGRSGVIAG